jgi:homoserine kinase
MSACVDVATAFAPATVANVAVGFDILGHTVEHLGDRVCARRVEEPGVRIVAVTGDACDIPVDSARNTAGRAVMALWERVGGEGGVELQIEKGIPLSSGLGGSAASAVAAVVAANALLAEPVDDMTLLRCAMQGEQVASGTFHLDNIGACLFGGLTLIVGVDNPYIKRIPVPDVVRCVLVHPHMQLATSHARQVLRDSVQLSDFVWQSANLGGFICGCYSGDLDLMRIALEDVVIQPQRAALIQGFSEVRAAAVSHGALGCSISGAGPTVFAWCNVSCVDAIRRAMVAAFADQGLESDCWVTRIDGRGARLEPVTSKAHQ